MSKTFTVHAMRVTTQAVLSLYASVGLASIVMDSGDGAHEYLGSSARLCMKRWGHVQDLQCAFHACHHPGRAVLVCFCLACIVMDSWVGASWCMWPVT